MTHYMRNLQRRVYPSYAIQVEQRHIDAGDPDSPAECPIALALNEARFCEIDGWAVAECGIVLDKETHSMLFQLDRVGARFLAAIAEREPVGPCEIRVVEYEYFLPDEWEDDGPDVQIVLWPNYAEPPDFDGVAKAYEAADSPRLAEAPTHVRCLSGWSHRLAKGATTPIKTMSVLELDQTASGEWWTCSVPVGAH